MFTEDGMYVLEDAQGQAQVTLDFACYGCHRDEAGQGGTFSTKTLAHLAEFWVDLVHPNTVLGSFLV